MRRLPAYVTVLATLGAGQAAADPSHDLVFCSKLSNAKERVACYDAAARIADRTTPRRESPSTHEAKATIVSPPLSPPAAPAMPFAGFNVAAGGSYGFMAPRFFSISDSVSFFQDAEHPQGWSGVLSAGYNIQIGNFVAGLDLRGRYGSERDTSVSTDVLVTTDNVATSVKQHEFTADASVHVAAKAGTVFGNTMLYGLAGIGMAHLVETSSAAGTGAICVDTEFTPFPNPRLFCQEAVPAPSSFRQTTQWVPSALLGVGIEQNVGQWFGRAEAQAEGIAFAHGAEFGWTMRALLAAGFRF